MNLCARKELIYSRVGLNPQNSNSNTKFRAEALKWNEQQGWYVDEEYVKKQLIGVFDKKWLTPIAETLKNLGSTRAMVVNGSDGLDEITTTGISYIAELKNNKVFSYEINPSDFDIAISDPSSLLGGEPSENAKKISNLLEGEKGSFRDIVLLNSAAALYVDGLASDIKEGIKLSNQSIDKGLARLALSKLIKASNS